MGRNSQKMTDRISPANKSGDSQDEDSIVGRTLPYEHSVAGRHLDTGTSRMVRQQSVIADDAMFSWQSFARHPSYPSQQLTGQAPRQMLYHTGLLQRHPQPISIYYPNRLISASIPQRPAMIADYLPKDCQYLRPRTDATTVPNIVIEHVSTVLQSCSNSSSHTLTPPFSSASARWSSDGSGPKIRAYSDSAVYDLKRQYSPDVTPDAGSSNVFHFDRPSASSPMSLSDHPDGSDDDRISDETNDYRIRDMSETSVEDLRRSFMSRTNASFSDQLRPDTMSWHHSDVARSTSCVGGLGAENSPKTYWLRRHSDSNTANEGDTSLPVSGESLLRVETLQVRSLSASESMIDSTDIPTAENNVVNERLVTDSSTSAVKLPVVDTELLQTPEKSKGLMQKRQKLKKYLQARYQSSLDQQAASSTDTDEVFVDKSMDDVNKEPTDLSPSSRVSTDLSPSSRMTSEISPSMSLEMNRLDEDAVFLYKSSEPLVGGEYTLRQNVACSVRSDVQFGSSKELQAPVTEPERWPVMSPCDQRLMSTISEQPVLRNAMRTETPIFTFPTLNLDVLSENLYPQSFPAVSPLGHHSPIGPACSSNPRLPSPLIIRKYSSLGSSVQSSTMLQQQQHRVGGSTDTNMSVVGRAVTYPGDATFNSQLTYDMDRRHQGLSLADHNVRSSAVSTSAPPSPVAPHIPCSPSYPHLLHPADVMMAAERQMGDQTQTIFYSFNKMIPQKHHAEDTSTTSSFSCPVCGMALSSYNLLANHMITHLPSEVVSVASSSGGTAEGSHVHLCKVCNRSFSRSDMLSRHMRLHTGLRPYECDLCGQVFSRSDHLHTHQRTHTGEKPYHCVHCVYAAPRRDMVTRHMRVHSRDTPSCRGRRSHSASSYPSDNPPGGGGGGGDDVVHSRTSSTSSCSRGGGGRGRKYKGELPGIRRISGSQQAERSRIWSLTSSAASTEGSEPSPGGILTPKEGTARGRGTVSRTWSITSAESSEMFSSPGYATPSAVWSPPVTDSPDVFSSSARQPKHFVWPAVAMTMDRNEDMPSRGSASVEQSVNALSTDEMMIISKSELQ